MWQSDWFPIQKLDELQQGQGNVVQSPSSGYLNSQQAEEYMRQMYPTLFQGPAYNAHFRPDQQIIDVNPMGQNNYHHQQQQQQMQQYNDRFQGQIQEVVATCDRSQCYKSCRLLLVGGGRCTKGGCMCYHSFFNYDGNPSYSNYPEDNIWYELTEPEKKQILDAMRSGIPVDPAAAIQQPARPPFQQQQATEDPWYGGGNGIDNAVTEAPDPDVGGDWYSQEEEEDDDDEIGAPETEVDGGDWHPDEEYGGGSGENEFEEEDSFGLFDDDEDW